MDEQPILLLGAAGQLGTELALAFGDRNLHALDRRAVDFAHPESLRKVIRDLRPSMILNAVAYTAVDRAESEAALADVVNHQAARVLAEEAERAHAPLIHYSTDYVFDGSKRDPWLETDRPAPLNVYGATKLQGEQAIAQSCRRYVILRTSWVFAEHGSNFLRTMLRLGSERPTLKVVNDQWGAPTSAAALAAATRSIVDRIEAATQADRPGHAAPGLPLPADWPGIYHATCAGQTTWCDFAETIFDAAEQRGLLARPQVEGIPAALYPTPARRPRYSVLSNQKLAETFGVQLPPWPRALEAVFDKVTKHPLHPADQA